MGVLPNRRHQRQSKPATDTYRWIVTIDEVDAGALEINGTIYDVTVLRVNGAVTGYRLMKQPDFKVYDLDTTGEQWKCDCPDATYRERECKHIRGLRALLSAEAK
jgi:hypothetical protein